MMTGKASNEQLQTPLLIDASDDGEEGGLDVLTPATDWPLPEHSKDTIFVKKQLPVIVRSGSVAIQALLLGVNLAANGKMLSMLSDKETGASAIVSTIQTLVFGTAGGFLFATGIEIAKPIGRREFIQAGNIAKSSWVLSLTLGSLSTLALVFIPYALSLTYSKEASELAGDFFRGYAASRNSINANSVYPSSCIPGWGVVHPACYRSNILYSCGNY